VEIQGPLTKAVLSGRTVSRRHLLQSLAAVAGSCAGARWFSPARAWAMPVPYQAEADVSATTVQYKAGVSTISAFLAKPAAGGKHPGLILVHDDVGLSDRFTGYARKLAAAGFVVLAPDLLSRVGGTASLSRPDAVQKLKELSPEGTLDDLKPTFEVLAKNPSVDAQRISAVGFGWGAWRVFLLAEQLPSLRKAVVFYGATPTEGLEKIQAPILAHYAQEDFRITGNAVLTEKRLGKKFTYYVYPKMYHTFLYEGTPAYDAEAASLAWKRTLDFLQS